MWIFKSTKDYGEMVDKISQSVFIISTILLFLLSQACPEFLKVLKNLSFGAIFKVCNIDLNIAIFYVPFLMGVFEHMFKLHNVWSKIFGIRKRYDRKIIVRNLISQCNIKNVNANKLSNEQVRKIMDTCFYRYASSSNPNIDSHYITITLTEWCWFWIILDTLMLFDVVGVIWLIMTWWSWVNFLWFVCVNVVLLILLKLVNYVMVKYTLKEIDAILSLKSNQNVTESVKKSISEEIKNALPNK